MQISDRIENDIAIVSLEGELVESNMDEVSKYLHFFLEDNVLKGIVADFKGIRRMDSSGIGMIVSIFLEFREKQVPFILCQLNDDLMQYFEMMSLDHVLSLYPSQSEAIASF